MNSKKNTNLHRRDQNHRCRWRCGRLDRFVEHVLQQIDRDREPEIHWMANLRAGLLLLPSHWW